MDMLGALRGFIDRSVSLSEALDPRRNALNFIRLVLAALVIVSHAAVLGGFEPMSSRIFYLGMLAVDGFFAISGFLIARSWDRNRSWTRYLWHRILRIFPAFWVCLVVTAFVFGPLVTKLNAGSVQGFWSEPGGPLSYVADRVLLISLAPETEMIAGLQGLHYPAWNAPLWTLYYEFLCYLWLGLLGSVGLIARNKRRWILAVFVAVWLLTMLRAFAPELGASYLSGLRVESVIRFTFMFLGGTLLYLYSKHIPMNGHLAAVAVVVVGVSVWLLPDYHAIGGLPLAYLVMWCGARLPIRIGLRTDISYGMYVYAFPTQQLLFALGAASLGWFGYTLLGIAATVPLALLSWYAVERPMLRLKNWSPGRRIIPEDLGEPPAAQGDLSSEQRLATSSSSAGNGSVRRRTMIAVAVGILALGYLGLLFRGGLIL